MLKNIIKKLLLLDRTLKFQIALPKEKVLFTIRKKLNPLVETSIVPQIYGKVTKEKFCIQHNGYGSKSIGSFKANGQVKSGPNGSIITVEGENFLLLVLLGIIWGAFLLLSLLSIPIALACVGSECRSAYFAIARFLAWTLIYLYALYSMQMKVKKIFIEWFGHNFRC